MPLLFNVKKWAIRLTIVLLIFAVVWLSFRAKILYYTLNGNSIVIGIAMKGKTEKYVDYDAVDAQIYQSEKAIKEADLMIQDARRRGILE